MCCEKFLWGRSDLAYTIKCLPAFEEAFTDVLYALVIHDLATILTLCQSITKQVSVVISMPWATFDLARLAEIGIKQVSVGSALARLARFSPFREK